MSRNLVFHEKANQQHWFDGDLLTTKAVIRFRCGCELEVWSPINLLEHEALKCCKNHDGTVFSWFNNVAELELRDINVQSYYDGQNFNGGHAGWDHGDWSKGLWARIKAVWRGKEKVN